MRPFALIIVTLFCLGVARVDATESYPYTASITVSETPVRSGPGEEFYPTSILRQGDKVDVYYESEHWCAIRPPEGSFSWISASYVHLMTSHLGVVVEDGLVARIGSDLGNLADEMADTVQVRLKKGEKVLVLGQLETPENPVSPAWLKIASPSGEYRWIARSALMTVPSRLNLQGQARNRLPARQLDRETPRRSIVQVVYQGDERGPEMMPAAPISEGPALASPEPSRASSAPVREITPLDELLAARREVRSQPVLGVDPFQKAFEDLKEATRIVMTRPVDDEEFEILIRRGNELYAVAEEKDLEKVYHLVETLQRTRAVRQEIAMRRQFRTGGLLTPPPSAVPAPISSARTRNYQDTLGTTNPVRISSNSGAPAPMPLAAATTQQRSREIARTAVASTGTSTDVSAFAPIRTAPESRVVAAGSPKSGEFDIVGKLGEFEPIPRNHPPYALVDEKEHIVCLISPADGVDLKKHVGETVGINGVLGHFEKRGEPKRRHITALEVQTLHPAPPRIP